MSQDYFSKYISDVIDKFPHRILLSITNPNIFDVEEWLNTLDPNSYYCNYYAKVQEKEFPTLIRFKHKEDYLVFQIKFPKS